MRKVTGFGVSLEILEKVDLLDVMFVWSGLDHREQKQLTEVVNTAEKFITKSHLMTFTGLLYKGKPCQSSKVILTPSL